MSLKQPGPWLFAIGLAGLGIAELLHQRLLPGLQPSGPWHMDEPSFAIASGLALIAVGVLSLWRPAYALIGLIVVAGPWIAGHATRMIDAPGEPGTWVSAAELVTFGCVVLMLARPRAWIAARVALGLTLVLFGAIHWIFPAAIAGLIPTWVPAASVWPWITGAVQVAAGIMILSGWRGAFAAFVVGLMWLSWVFVVHILRVISAPGDLFEWTFMLTAVALAGAAWSVGERFEPSNRA